VIVLGIDSASTSGWGLLDGERPVGYGTVDARDPNRIVALVSFVCAKARPDLVAIEDNYLGKNVDTVKVLSRIVGMWQMAFALRGVPTELLMPNIWQNGILRGLISPKSQSADRKRAAALWVKATYRLATTGDAADALGLATFVARRELFAGKVRAVGAGALPRAVL
jgi:Holliday junction resolvasome RuvABC endonuclease subunit